MRRSAEVCLLLNQQKHSILIYKKTIILIIIKLTLEELRSKAFFQNTIDTWIMFCEEKGLEWYDVNGYRAFINHLNKNGAKMQKFPLCIKESGGMYERGRDKTKFLEELSKFSGEDVAAYTLKLSNEVLHAIRSYK